MNKRSPFFYVGDKYKLMPQLSKYFPDAINNLIEPFCGGGSVFLNTNANSYLANDKNYYMVKLHELLKFYAHNRNSFFEEFESLIKKYNLSASFLGINVPTELKKKYVKTYYAKYNKEGFLKAKSDFNIDKTNIILLYLLLIYGFNHMLRFNSSGDFNLPVGNVDYNKNVFNALNGYFDFVENENINFSNQDFTEFLENIKYKNGDFVYLDPPYLISACEYNKGWTEQNELVLLQLLDKLNERGVKFALSNVFTHKGRSNVLLIEWSKKYHVYSVKSNYISYHDNTIKDTKEVLITNYLVEDGTNGKKEK